MVKHGAVLCSGCSQQGVVHAYNCPNRAGCCKGGGRREVGGNGAGLLRYPALALQARAERQERVIARKCTGPSKLMIVRGAGAFKSVKRDQTPSSCMKL